MEPQDRLISADRLSDAECSKMTHALQKTPSGLEFRLEDNQIIFVFPQVTGDCYYVALSMNGRVKSAFILGTDGAIKDSTLNQSDASELMGLVKLEIAKLPDAVEVAANAGDDSESIDNSPGVVKFQLSRAFQRFLKTLLRQ